jgi:hypothetical protein
VERVPVPSENFAQLEHVTSRFLSAGGVLGLGKEKRTEYIYRCKILFVLNTEKDTAHTFREDKVISGSVYRLYVYLYPRTNADGLQYIRNYN